MSRLSFYCGEKCFAVEMFQQIAEIAMHIGAIDTPG
jgi:hypothetical protein